MDRSQRLRLQNLIGRNPAQLRAEDPAAYQALRDLATEKLRAALLSHFADASEQVRGLVQRLDLTGLAGDGSDLRAGLFAAVAEADLPPDVATEARDRIARLSGPVGLDGVLKDGVPLGGQRLGGELQEQAVLDRLGAIAGLTADRIQQLVDGGLRLAAIDDAALSARIASGALKPPEATQLGLVASIYQLSDGNADVAAAIRAAKIPSLGGRAVTHVFELAAIDGALWQRLLGGAGITPPAGETVAGYAIGLRRRIERIFPAAALIYRAAAGFNAAAVTRDLRQLQPLFDRNPRLLGAVPNTAIAMDGLTTAQKRSLSAALGRVNGVAALYPGMEIAALLDDRSQTPDARIQAAAARAGTLPAVLALNPGVDLLALDYTPGSADLQALKLDGFGEADQARVLASFKAYQRLHALSGDVDTTVRLLGAGLDSATRLASLGADAIATRTGFDAATAQRLLSAASTTVDTAGILAGSLIGLHRGGIGWAQVANVGPDVADYLRAIDGFAELFGSQADCHCEDCHSILSPAAYFVDLMHFVEEHVLTPYFAGKPNHVLHLRMRRPDLWTVPLTCENTDTRIPALQIVDEVLENYLAPPLGYTGGLSDRGGVERTVYEQTLSQSVDSFLQPFVLPLEQVQGYLSYFQRSRADVAKVIGAPIATVASARLELGSREHTLIIQSNANLRFLSRVFDIDFQARGLGVAPIDAHDLLEPVGVTRDELQQLAATTFVSGRQPFTIVAEKRDSTSVQNDVEHVYNLTPASLDRLHRFVRLWRHVPWSIPELDLVLRQIEQAGIGAGIGEETLLRLAAVLDVQDRFGLQAEENAALWSLLPDQPLPGFPEPLFDRLFNLAPFVLLDGRLPMNRVRVLHPALSAATAASAPNPAIHRLVAGLRVSDEDLAALIGQLALPLGATPQGFLLTTANLSLLYRHARLAGLLQLSIADLVQLISLAGLTEVVRRPGPGPIVPRRRFYIGNLDDLNALLDFVDWWHSTAYTLDDLAYVSGAAAVHNPGAYPDAAAIAAVVVDAVQADKALQFAGTVFAFLPNVTEEQSRRVVAQNLQPPARLETADGGFRLALDFDPSDPGVSLALPADLSAFPEADARSALTVYHPRNVIPAYLARALSTPAEKLDAIIGLTGVNLGDPAFALALRRETPAGQPDPLLDLVRRLLPLTVLFRAPAFDADAIGFVGSHPGIFGLTSLPQVDIAGVKAIAAFGSVTGAVTARRDDTTGHTDVQTVLQAFDPTRKFGGADQAALERVFAAGTGLLSTVGASVTLSGPAPIALLQLGRALELAQYLGVGGNALQSIASAEYPALAGARDALLAAFRAKNPDEQQWQAAVGPYDDAIRERKRDALVDFLLHSIRPRRAAAGPLDPIRSINPDFRTIGDLYDYFLIDARVEGPVTISRVVSAISSVQHYVQRCLLNLEQDSRDIFDPAHIAIPPDSIPADEWEWRQLYRFWEANREVFLWPENYIEPQLRDDKTPLFVELESSLLQQEITEDTVLDAFGTYLNGFDELGRLRIAGAFHDRTGTPDMLHLFGVGGGDPPEHYYRTVENAFAGERTDIAAADRPGIVWSPWRKVNVQIPARNVAPIIFGGRLYLFWLTISSSPLNAVQGGSSQFAGYQHRLTLSYTTLRLDGSWAPPQALEFPIHLPNDFPFKGRGVVVDPLVDRLKLSAMAQDVGQRVLDPNAARAFAKAVADLDDDQFKQFVLALEAARPTTGALAGLVSHLRRYRRSHVASSHTEGADQTGAAGELRSFAGSSGFTGLTFLTGLADALGAVGLPDSLVRFYASDPTTAAELDQFHIPRYDTKPHLEAREGYTLTGPYWLDVYPSVSGAGELQITASALQYLARIALYNRATAGGFSGGGWTFDRMLVGDAEKEQAPILLATTPPPLLPFNPGDPEYKPIAFLDQFSFCSVAIEKSRLAAYAEIDNDPYLVDWLYGYLSPQPVAEVPDGSRFAVVNGSVEDAIVDLNGDLVLLQGSVRPAPVYLATRLSTTLGGQLVRTLFSGGVEGLLDLGAQNALVEADLPITSFSGAIEDAGDPTLLDYRGPFGVYYREIYFHAPFLIANYLNSQGRYDVAQKWYHHIFNPTAQEHISMALSAPDRAKAERDRVWRYREFRGLDVQSLRDLLTDKNALEAHRHNPFNPHAIARLRLGAYQKTIVMKYIDNLLDWGDDLFARFTTESVNEATLLYVLASEILGERPAELGDCGEDAVSSRTYERIAPSLNAGDNILIELESFVLTKRRYGVTAGATAAARLAVGRSVALAAAKQAAPATTPASGATPPAFRGYNWNGTLTGAWTGNAVLRRKAAASGTSGAASLGGRRFGGFGPALVRQISPAFCIPANADFRDYWNRVDDRLFKIRNGRDITGASRELPLFAPEIDPRLLVRAKALGLSIEEVLDSTSGDLPPYRFSYLIERAKAATATVQAFGAALLSALEKKDGEDLNGLRTTQQQHIQKLSRQSRQWEIDAAQATVDALEAQRDAIEFRREFYQSLVSQGRTGNETAQTVGRHAASTIVPIAALLDTGAAVFALVTQVGSPFALTWGGIQLNSSWEHYARVARDTAQIAEAVSASAGLEAGFDRRDQGWKNQRDLAKRELDQIKHQIDAARLRLEIANESLSVHDRSIEQTEQLYLFFVDKFSNLGLYTWLASTLQRAYRDAYNSAYAMARLAEQAYRFERGDDGTSLLGGGYWESPRAGLLAGERLLIDLQGLERRFIETNARGLEIDQAFSLTQIDPLALLRFRLEGTCEFNVDEIFFDLFYPGHYRRRIKSVRLTIPCITGPYTNVGATLSLTKSFLRKDPPRSGAPRSGTDGLAEVPLRRSTTIATSTAQNDAGVFELNFRDERYMPFEGAGAVSGWRLSLPQSFRQFDYQTITDVIIHISYTAEQDDVFRQAVEDQNQAMETSLLSRLRGLTLRRVLSLRQDYSTAFNRLLYSAPNTPIPIEISDRYFPFFLKNRVGGAEHASLVVRTAGGIAPDGLALSIDGVTAPAFLPDSDLGGLGAAGVDDAFTQRIIGTHTLTLTEAGGLAPAAAAPGGPAIDPDKLEDVLLYIEYRLQN